MGEHNATDASRDLAASDFANAPLKNVLLHRIEARRACQVKRRQWAGRGLRLERDVSRHRSGRRGGYNATLSSDSSALSPYECWFLQHGTSTSVGAGARCAVFCATEKNIGRDIGGA